jgi:hypothetical protein
VRTVFSLRFLLALGALAGLALLAWVFVGEDDGIAEVVEPELQLRRIDLVSLVFEARPDGFELVDGVSTGRLDLILDAERTVRIVPGTPGEVTCETLDELATCAVVADLLGDGVVWFSIVPIGPRSTVEMPAITVLESDVATLENGWQVPYAPILERTCSRDFESFRAFREELGTDFTSVYDLAEGRLTEVVCDES